MQKYEIHSLQLLKQTLINMNNLFTAKLFFLDY